MARRRGAGRGARQGELTRALFPGDPGYPSRLRDLATPPAPVYLRGPWDHDGPIVAIVGSRNAPAEGIDLARSIAADLAREGVAVVSGLARGIDAAAHEGALEAGGRSGAALGTTLDACFPSEHRELQDRLAGSLGLMTELPPGAHASRATFASRNRLLAAIAHAVILVQADLRSGALLTVRAAETLRRPVGAVPWHSMEPYAAAPHQLIRERRAVLVRNAADVMELVGESASPLLAAALAVRAGAPSRQRRPATADRGPREGAAGRVLEGLRLRAEPLDVVASRASLTAGETSAALLALELAGLARREPGGRYRRVRGA